MTENKKTPLEERMQALKEKYYRQLPEKYNEIVACWNEYQIELTNSDFIETFYRLVHTFKGTAATFGFITQSDTCFKIQKLLLQVKEDHTALKEDNVKKIHKYIDELKNNLNTPPEDI